MISRRHLPAVLLAAALLTTGVRDSQGAVLPVANAAKAPITRKDLKPVSKNLKKEPKVPRQRQGPAARLISKNIVKGSGKVAASADQLTVQYTGYALSTGKKFDASWDVGTPFAFTLGVGQVIAGWDKGVAGMRVGGRRELVIPAKLAYGSAGSPPAIGPNETLIFVIDLKSVK